MAWIPSFNDLAKILGITSAGTVVVATVNQPFEIWTTNDALGPTLSYNAIGFNNSGVGSSILHRYYAATDDWTATTQTFNGFIGL